VLYAKTCNQSIQISATQTATARGKTSKVLELIQ